MKPFLRFKTAFRLMAAAAFFVIIRFALFPPRTDRWSFYSESLGERRRILVRPPAGSDSAAVPHPLIILLDGGDEKMFSADRPLYSRSKDVLAALEKEGFPPMILVGVANRDRVRDMTPVERPDIYVGGGGSRAFMDFIETEVIPFVEKRWPIGPTRILYGESYGGLFVLDALARGRQAFTDYIAVSPAVGVWPEGLAAAFRRRFERSSAVRSLFVIFGERDAPLVVEPSSAFVREIADLVPPGFRLRKEIIPGEGHDPESSLERGLRFIFERKTP